MPKSKSKSKNDSSSAAGGQVANVRHILCEKHSKKEEALYQLRSGIPFNTVASQYSEDKARQGGLLGWKTQGDLIPEFATAAFKLPPSTVSSPIIAEARTSEGYHIIMVEGFR